MELHNLKSGAPDVELCGYIIALWYSAILGFCPHIKTKQKYLLTTFISFICFKLNLYPLTKGTEFDMTHVNIRKWTSRQARHTVDVV